MFNLESWTCFNNYYYFGWILPLSSVMNGADEDGIGVLPRSVTIGVSSMVLLLTMFLGAFAAKI